MVKENKNAAIIVVKREYLAKLLDFEGGNITSVNFKSEYYNPDDVEFLVEHPDLPEVEPGFLLLKIKPIYNSTIGRAKVGDKQISFEKIERIHPPKKKVAKTK